MKKRLSVMTIGMVFFISSTAIANLGIYSEQKIKPNGEFIIYVMKDNQWKKAGAIPFDRFFREKELDLGSIAPDNKPLWVKLEQKGGGAAHLDFVSLGGLKPNEVKGSTDESALKKASKRDYDVLDAFGKALEFRFGANSNDKKLTLTARIEETTVAELPFQFPKDNNLYTYKLNSQKAPSKSTLFRELSLTGSGHPSGFTYGWVWNDRDYLYSRIDFTPDNTMDGDKDYSKISVKTNTGLKEFKITASENKWGKALFTYTDKVKYQHKVYDFKIPLKEIGDLNNNENLLLAFSAYGTAAPGDAFPSIAFDTENNRYLVAYRKYADSKYQIYAQLIDAAGSAVGDEFVITTINGDWPAVAYDSADQKFLVVWQDMRGTTGKDIYGQIVNADGTLAGGNFAISTATGEQSDPAVSYDNANKRFFVAWDDNRSGTNSDIYGQLIKADGTLSGSNFVISGAADNQTWPSMAYDSANQRFLVIWQSSPPGGESDLYGQLVNADGSLSGGSFAVSTATKSQSNTSTAYDDINQSFLVAWDDNRSGANFDIYGQLITADGTLSGSELAISNATNRQQWSSTAFDNINKRFLAVWDDERHGATNSDIYGQFLNTDGTLSGNNFIVSNATGNQLQAAVANNSNCGNFLVAYTTYADTTGDIGFGLVGDPCETTPPTVASTSPANNATEVATNSAVTATFDEALKASTITTETFKVSGVTGTVAYDSATNTATFTPSSVLGNNETYTATVTTGVKDRALNNMAADYTWSFTTAMKTGGGGCQLLR